MGYSGARGTLIYEKNLKSKISCQTPFKCTVSQVMASEWDEAFFSSIAVSRLCYDKQRIAEKRRATLGQAEVDAFEV
jgi:hypothetical protein